MLEESLMKEDKANIVLGWRLFRSLCKQHVEEDVLLNNLKCFKFEFIIEWICNQLINNRNDHQQVNKRNDKEPILLIIAFDEYQKVFRKDNIRTKLLHVIGSASCNTISANEFTKRNNVCLIPIIAGTILEKDFQKEFEITGYGRYHFHLPPLETNHCKFIFEELCSKQTGSYNKLFQLITKDNQIIDPNILWSNGNFSILYSQMAMIPKQAVIFHNTIVSYCKETSFEEWNSYLLYNTISSLKTYLIEKAEKTSSEFPLSRELYDLILSGNEWNILQKDEEIEKQVNQLINGGMIYLSTNKSIYCNWYHFLYLLKMYNPTLHYLLSNFPFTNLRGNHFEKIGTLTLLSRMNNLVNNGFKFVSLSTLFPQIINGSGINNINLMLPKFKSEYCEEQEYFLPTINHQEANENIVVSTLDEYDDSPLHSFVKELKPSLIYLSKPNQQLVNARWFTVDENNNKVVILIQWKLNNSGNLKIDEVLSLREYNNLKIRYRDFKVYYILITTADVSPTICDDDYQKHVLFIDRKTIKANFAPNIMPYIFQ